MKNTILKLFALSCFAIASTGCKKYLDAKSDQALVTIGSLRDMQSLLDNNEVNVGPSSDMLSADDYYLSYTDYLALTLEQQRNIYTWQPANLFQPYTNVYNDWNQVYNNVYKANIILDNIDNVNKNSDQESWNNIKGQALFLRSYNFYRALMIWSLAYDEQTAVTDLGIPLRLNSDFNKQSIRASVSESYKQVLSDILQAKALLSGSTVSPYRSSRPAAMALLSKIYLSMRNFDKAGVYADSCLQLSGKLLDYNTLNTAAPYPIPQFNTEVLYDVASGGSTISRSRIRVDSVLYSSYDISDIRKSAFFVASTNGSYLFKGSYEGGSTFFSGLSLNEVYLTKAECLARQGNTAAAMDVLNALLKNRYRSANFVPLNASDSSDALQKILKERRKELLLRDVRWADIKRLNKGGLAIDLKRVLNGKTYNLPANDLRSALALPDDIIVLTGMPQNLR